jgi:hypothetical protein
LEQSTQDEVTIYNEAIRILISEWVQGTKIRLIGISASKLGPVQVQFDLFDQSSEKKRRLASAVDTIRAQHGAKAIRRITE